MNRKNVFMAVLLISALFGTAAFSSHPLVDHWAETASSSVSTFGSKWIHTDTSGTR